MEYMTKITKKQAQKPQIHLPEKIISVLTSYIKTQMILMLAVTIVSWMALTVIGVQFSLLLAVMTGSLSVIPILGMTVAGIIVSAVAVFDSIRFLPGMSVLFEGVVVIAMYGILNFIIDYFLSPYLIGKSSGVHPVVLLVFVVMGTFLFGMWGAFLTVPVILTIKTISRHYTE